MLRLLGDVESARNVADAGIQAAVESSDTAALGDLTLLAAELAEAAGDLEGAMTAIEISATLAVGDDPVASLSRDVTEHRLQRKLGADTSELTGRRLTLVAEARQLPRQRFEEHPALLRDLAAEVAGDDLQIAAEAVRIVGLGAGSGCGDDRRARDGARSLGRRARWSAGKPGGGLVELARVEGEGADAWRTWLAGRTQVEWAREIRRLLLEYPEDAAPILGALQHLFRAAGEHTPRA